MTLTTRKPLTEEKLLGSERVMLSSANNMKVILVDMMLNDPIIANYPPEEVYKAFVELIQIAPIAASKSETLRILLRKRLTAGILEPKDIQDLSRMEYEIIRAQKSGKGLD